MLEPIPVSSGSSNNPKDTVEGNEQLTTGTGTALNTTEQSQPVQNVIEEGNFVVVIWNGKRFPGLVMSKLETGAIVDCMQPTPRYWKWPTEKDMLFYKWSDIVQVIKPPKLLKRGLFSVNMPT